MPVMSCINSLYVWLMKNRLKEIDSYARNAQAIQHKQWAYLVGKAADTEYGRKYHFHDLRSEEDFRQRVPLASYEDLRPYVERLMQGEDYLLWPEKIRWFSKSSGTTHSKSKYIPVSREALARCHYKGGKDMYALYMRQYPDSGVFFGKTVSMGGSLHTWDTNPGIQCGDVSALLTRYLPSWAESRRIPKREIAMMEDWEKKLPLMVQATWKADVRSIMGVPSWILVYLEKLLEISGKRSLREIWPGLELLIHGGVSFTPYRKQFSEILGGEARYLETYNASEGFFAMQDISGEDMLLMLDYGIYYEFLPMEEWGKENPGTVGIEGVETGKNYALVISTNAGLWRYLIGDTVVFTSLRPYRIRISGRTKHFINTFGEELMVDNADSALSFACAQTGAEIADYTAAPVFLDQTNQARHQWLIEFKKSPEDLTAFTQFLDSRLKSLNSDYEAKRFKDLLLKSPEIVSLPNGTFHEWLKGQGKLGGQHKVPRLNNNRDFAEEILVLIGKDRKRKED